jgi:triosephosphate isomerase (TIM)
MSRRFVVAGNFKMNLLAGEASALAAELRAALEAEPPACEVILAPVFTSIHAVREALQGSPIALAAQNVHFESSGAFTGEVGAGFLADAGCTHVIVGHSERRQLFGERDADVREKAKAALDAGLTPIVCVGETLSEREAGQAEAIVLGQVASSLEGVDPQRVILAYEPVWAIGTGRTASPEDAQEMHAAIRSSLLASIRDKVRILYGGSVKPDNAEALLGQPDVDGALVGGASLKTESFLPIIRAAKH